MKKFTKKDKLLLILSAAILVGVTAFLIIFWDTAYSIIEKLLTGVDIVGDYIRAFGAVGIIVMMLIIIVCFFFPVVSSLPIQVACGITYGILGGGAIILGALFIATQLLYLFRQNAKFFSSERHLKKKAELEALIHGSDRNIYFALIVAYLLPAVPFLVISNLAASGLKYPKYTLVTLLGMIPDVLTTIFVGEKLLSSSPTASIVTLIAIIVIIALSIIFNDRLVAWVFAPKKKEDEQD